MSARSSFVLVLLGGCDVAFGVGGDPEPCELSSFDAAGPTELTSAFRFSIDWDQRFAVIVGNDGINRELDLRDGTSQPIDLGPYSILNLALDPEGDALLYTSSTEPMILEGALRAAPGSWKLAARAPAATLVGTPSADVFGPRRMLARVHPYDTDAQGQPTVQELEDQDGVWVPIGAAHPLVADMPPNLTPNGLTAVFSRDVESATGLTTDVFGMTRSSTEEWFGEPVRILSNGTDHSPQLLGHCERLYTIHSSNDGPTLTRYDR